MRLVKKAYELEDGDYVRIAESDFLLETTCRLSPDIFKNVHIGRVNGVELDNQYQLCVFLKCQYTGTVFSLEVKPDTLFKIVGETQ